MAKHFIVIENGNHSVSGSFGWKYSADENAVYLGSVNHGYYVIAKGNYIGKEVVVDLCGQYSEFLGEKKIPKNPVRRVLYEHGFFRCHETLKTPGFMGYFDPEEESWESFVVDFCGDEIHSHDIKRWELRSLRSKKPLICAACGIIDWRDKWLCMFWIKPGLDLTPRMAREVKTLFDGTEKDGVEESGKLGWFYKRVLYI